MARFSPPAFAAALAAVSLAVLIGLLFQREAPDLVYGAKNEITKPLPGFEERLRVALRFRTVSALSSPSHLEDPGEMLALHDHLKKSFPLTWKTLKPTTISDFSLLFEWEGSDKGAAPGLLISHLDVVPAAEDDEEEENDENAAAATSWASTGGGPFDGVLTDGGDEEDSYFVGRGSLDVKGGALALLEAVEALLSPTSSSSFSSDSSSSSPPFTPRRTLLIALGHDEEVGGSLGAQAMAREIERRLLRASSSAAARNQTQPRPPPRLAFALDEGGVVLPAGLPPLLNVPVAAVATAEKGYASLKLSVKGSGGHSAMPPPAAAATAAAALAKAAAAADAGRPRPRLVRPTTDMLRAAGRASGIRGARLSAEAVASLAEFGGKGRNDKGFLFLRSLARAFTSRIALAAARASPPPVAAQLATTVAITRLETGLGGGGGGGGEDDEKKNGSEGTRAQAAEEEPKPKPAKKRKTAAAADNVIPPFASMTLNYRPLPGDDAGVVPLEHLRRAAATAGLEVDEEKTRTKERKKSPVSASISSLRIEQASAVTPADSKLMQALRRALSKSGIPGEKGMAIVPVLLVGATDSRAYRHLLSSSSSSSSPSLSSSSPPSPSDPGSVESRILRFQPFATTMADLRRVHAAGERLSKKSYVEGIRFYQAFITEADAEEVDL